MASTLEIEIQRLARRASVMNIGLSMGLPLILVEALVAPLAQQACRVLLLVSEAIDMGNTDLHVQLDEAMPPGIADLLAKVIAGEIPDDLSSLFGED